MVSQAAVKIATANRSRGGFGGVSVANLSSLRNRTIKLSFIDAAQEGLFQIISALCVSI